MKNILIILLILISSSSAIAETCESAAKNEALNFVAKNLRISANSLKSRILGVETLDGDYGNSRSEGYTIPYEIYVEVFQNNKKSTPTKALALFMIEAEDITEARYPNKNGCTIMGFNSIDSRNWNEIYRIYGK